MEIIVKNLGLIRKANIKLKPLTIFIGSNNTNKSWLAYTIYSLFDLEIINGLAYEYINENSTFSFTSLRKELYTLIRQLEEKGYLEIDIVKFIDNNIEKFFSDFTLYLEKNLYKVLFNIDETQNPTLEIKLNNKEKYLKNLKIKSLEYKEEKLLGFISCIFQKDSNSETLIVKLDYVKDSKNNKFSTIDYHRVIFQFLQIFRDAFFNKNFVIPSERSGLIAIDDKTPHEMILKIMSLLNEFSTSIHTMLNNSVNLTENYVKLMNILTNINRTLISLPNKSKHIEDFLLMMMSAKTLNNSNGKNSEKLGKFLNLLFDILGGRVFFDKNEAGRKLKFVLETNSDTLPIESASSLVKSLVPLQWYLEYFATFNDLVVIDEPELNLHPEAQAKLIELFCNFVNYSLYENVVGTYFLITTHTPFFLEHLFNLVLLANLEKEKRKKIAKKYTFLKEDVFMNPDNLSIYYFDIDGEVREVFNREELDINWETFSNVAMKITQLSFEVE